MATLTLFVGLGILYLTLDTASSTDSPRKMPEPDWDNDSWETQRG